MTDFQVICVARMEISHLPEWAKDMHIPCPEVGTEYTVCGIVRKGGLMFYELVGFINQECDARAFATLPGLSAEEIDELEKEGVIK